LVAALFLDDEPLEALLFLPRTLEILLDAGELLTETDLVPVDLRVAALFLADFVAEDRPPDAVFFAMPLEGEFLDVLFLEDAVNFVIPPDLLLLPPADCFREAVRFCVPFDERPLERARFAMVLPLPELVCFVVERPLPDLLSSTPLAYSASIFSLPTAS
jgi:hypothetical protein